MEEQTDGAISDEQADEATSDEQTTEATSDEQADGATSDEQTNGATSDEQTNGATSDEQTTEATSEEQVAEAALKKQAKAFAVALEETKYVPLKQIKRALEVIGTDRMQELVNRSVELHANEGMMTNNGDRKRTVGGIFFRLLKETVTRKERRDIFTYLSKLARQNRQNQTNNQSYTAKPVIFEDLQEIIIKLFDDKKKGEANTVKMTIIGRPGKVVEKGSVALTSMKGSSPKNLSKALPSPPDETPVYVIYITMKQWKKVKMSINKNPDDKLIVEGYPMFDKRIGQNGAMTLYAQSVKSKLMEQEKRETQKAAAVAKATTNATA